LARFFGLNKLKENKGHYGEDGKAADDPWKFLFKQGVLSRNKDDDDIVPYWVFETKNGIKIDRNVPCLPLSRDVQQLKELKKSLAIYRMVFGQPRQGDLIEFLKKVMDEEDIDEEMKNFRIDLSPE